MAKILSTSQRLKKMTATAQKFYFWYDGGQLYDGLLVVVFINRRLDLHLAIGSGGRASLLNRKTDLTLNTDAQGLRSMLYRATLQPCQVKDCPRMAPLNREHSLQHNCDQHYRLFEKDPDLQEMRSAVLLCARCRTNRVGVMVSLCADCLFKTGEELRASGRMPSRKQLEASLDRIVSKIKAREASKTT